MIEATIKRVAKETIDANPSNSFNWFCVDFARAIEQLARQEQREEAAKLMAKHKHFQCADMIRALPVVGEKGGRERTNVATDRNDASEIQRDIVFLRELKADLIAGQNGDPIRLQSLGEKLDHWIEELNTK